MRVYEPDAPARTPRTTDREIRPLPVHVASLALPFRGLVQIKVTVSRLAWGQIEVF